MVAHETGLVDRIALVPTVLSPVEPSIALNAANPLGKIPALETDDGEVIYDSHVILDALDAMHGGPRMIPTSGKERTRVLRVEALADGILDAGILVRYEMLLRPAELRWPDWILRQREKAERGLDVLQADVATFPEAIDLRHVAAACAVGWLLFRNPVEGIAARWPELHAFFVRFSERPSMQATEPTI